MIAWWRGSRGLGLPALVVALGAMVFAAGCNRGSNSAEKTGTVSLAAATTSGLVVGEPGIVVSGEVRTVKGKPKAGVAVTLTTTAGTFTANGLATIVVTTNANGVFTTTLDAPTTPGSASVSATADGVGATPVTLTFGPGAPASVVLALSASTVTADGATTVSATVTVKDQFGNAVADGTTVTLSAAGAAGTGSIAPTTGGTAGGLLHGVFTAGTKSGTVTIQATVGTMSDVETITLTPGAVQQLTLIASAGPATVNAGTLTQFVLTGTAKDTNGNDVADGTAIDLVYTGSTGAVTTPVTTAGGIFSATVSGETVAGSFSAQAKALSGTVQSPVVALAFIPAAPASIALQLAATSVVANGSSTVGLTVTVLDSFGNNAANGTPVTLTASGPAGSGTVAPATSGTASGKVSGTFTAGTRTGTVTITAATGALSDAKDIDVLPGALANIALTLVPGTAVADDTGLTQYTVNGTATDANGNAVADGTAIDFTMTAAGTVDPAATTTAGGAFSAAIKNVTVAGASYTVTAKNGAVSDTRTFAIAPAAPATITLTLGSSSITVGTTTSASGTVEDRFGNAVADGTAVTIGVPGGSFAPASPVTTGGVYTTTLQAGTVATPEGSPATVDVSAGAATNQAQIAFTPDLPVAFALAPVDGSVTTADGICQVVVSSTAQVKDRFGNVVYASEPFTASASAFGIVAGPSVVNGIISITVQAGATPGSGSVTVTSVRAPGVSATLLLGLEENVFSDMGAVLPPAGTSTIVVLADMDHDGDLDVIDVPTGTVAPIALGLGNGDGTFGAMVPSAEVIQANGAAAADFERSGQPTLVVSDASLPGTLHGFAYDAAGGVFQEVGTITPTLTLYGQVEIADVDVNGYMDILAARAGPRDNSTVDVILGPIEDFALETAVFHNRIVRFAVGDVTLDGYPDIVAITADDTGGSYLEVAVNIGGFSGQFSEGEVTPLSDPATDIALWDVDQDGDLDAVVTFAGTNTRASVFLNTRLDFARFTDVGLPDLLPNGAAASFDTVRVEDFNLDGRPDVLVGFTVGSAGRVGLFRQDASGGSSFSEPMITSWGFEIPSGSRVAAGDIDRDGRPDLGATVTEVCLGSSVATGTSFVRGIGAPRGSDFDAAREVDLTYDAGEGPATPTALFGIAAGDVRLDGGPDLVVLADQTTAITVDFDGGKAVTGKVPSFGLNLFADQPFPASPVLDDFDLDGALDLAYDDAESTNEAQADGLTVASGDLRADPVGGDGTFGQVFGPGQILADFGGSLGFLLAGDFDAGYGTDLLTLDPGGLQAEFRGFLGSGGSGALRVVTNDGGDLFFNWDPVSLNFPNFDIRATVPYRGVTGHFDADGALDVAFIAQTRSDIVFLAGDPYNQTGNNTLFQEPPSAPQVHATLAAWSAIAAADFDRDAIDDVVVVGSGQALVITPKPDPANPGAMRFVAHFVGTLGNHPTAVVTADFNRDGKMDFAVAETGASGATVTIFLGNGKGGFQRLASPLTTGGVEDVLDLIVVDLDHDGRGDLVARTATKVLVFFAR